MKNKISKLARKMNQVILIEDMVSLKKLSKKVQQNIRISTGIELFPSLTEEQKQQQYRLRGQNTQNLHMIYEKVLVNIETWIGRVVNLNDQLLEAKDQLSETTNQLSETTNQLSETTNQLSELELRLQKSEQIMLSCLKYNQIFEEFLMDSDGAMKRLSKALNRNPKKANRSEVMGILSELYTNLMIQREFQGEFKDQLFEYIENLEE